jgi:hypothetical protein
MLIKTAAPLHDLQMQDWLCGLLPSGGSTRFSPALCAGSKGGKDVGCRYVSAFSEWAFAAVVEKQHTFG